MPGKVKTILFVEDSEVERLAYQKVLERAGYQVQLAKDGLDGLRLLHKIVPDLILLDLVLPRFDGVEVLKFVKSEPRLKTVPVVIFSTNSIIEVQDEPVLEGAIRRLLKGQCNPVMMLETIYDIFAEQDGETSDDSKKTESRSAGAAKP
jgi:chemosensory pili system protein ChpA (sensor histidine kinase/response regulator)